MYYNRKYFSIVFLLLVLSCADIEQPFISELGQHLQHVDADLLWIVVQPRADEAEAVRRQDAAMQLVRLVLLVLLIFLI